MENQREAMLIQLYEEAFPRVAVYVARRGGTFEQARDIFQEALVCFYEKKTREPESIGQDDIYLLGIAKNLWHQQFKADQRNTPLEDGLVAGLPDEEEKAASPEKVLAFLKTAGQRCLEVLKAFYYDREPMTAIASSFGFSGVRSATVQKYKCLEKVRDTVKQKSLTYEDFFE